MVDGMAQQCGGRLALRSTQGSGTTAEIWLPIATQSPALGKDNGSVTPYIWNRSLRIMVIDDDPLVLRNAIALLEDAGHEVIAATSAAEGLEMLLKTDVDLLITDHLMPMMTGTQLIEEIKIRFPTLPVLIMSGYREESAMDAANVPRLMKPFSQQQLLEAIRSVM